METWLQQTKHGTDGVGRQLEPSGCRPCDSITYLPIACGKQWPFLVMQICPDPFIKQSAVNHPNISNSGAFARRLLAL